MPRTLSPDAPYRIQVIDRATQILECFHFDAHEFSVREISQRTGLHKSTAHRILIALQYNGLIQQNPETANYHLGIKLFKLEQLAVMRLNLRESRSRPPGAWSHARSSPGFDSLCRASHRSDR